MLNDGVILEVKCPSPPSAGCAHRVVIAASAALAPPKPTSNHEGAPMYLSAKAIADLEGQKKVHFLNEAAVRINQSLGDAVGLKNIGVHVITVMPGHYSTEHHAHRFEEECVYVLSGQGTAFIGQDTQLVGPGDFIGCPLNGVAHSMMATGPEPLVCLVMGQRLNQDVTDYPNQAKRLYRNNGEWNVVDHASIRHVQR
jgi:uncharacterized cupin superfamily protein